MTAPNPELANAVAEAALHSGRSIEDTLKTQGTEIANQAAKDVKAAEALAAQEVEAHQTAAYRRWLLAQCRTKSHRSFEHLPDELLADMAALRDEEDFAHWCDRRFGS